MGKYRIQICSDADYEELIAEISIDGKFVALVARHANGALVVDFPRVQNEDAVAKRVHFSTLMEALGAARIELLGDASNSED